MTSGALVIPLVYIPIDKVTNVSLVVIPPGRFQPFQVQYQVLPGVSTRCWHAAMLCPGGVLVCFS